MEKSEINNKHVRQRAPEISRAPGQGSQEPVFSGLPAAIKLLGDLQKCPISENPGTEENVRDEKSDKVLDGRLLTHDELPEWLKDNEFVTTFHRPEFRSYYASVPYI